MPDEPVPTTARYASLPDLAALLKVQQDNKLDAVVPASAITSHDGVFHVAGLGEPVVPDTVDALLNDDEVAGSAAFRPTSVCDEGVSDKLGIPLPYLRKLRSERPDLYDANVNGWLRGTADIEPGTSALGHVGPDPRKFLLRTFRNPDGGEGVARALLSDSYRTIDNLDVLTAALQGVRESGADVEVLDADLTERRMSVRLVAPGIQAYAPKLLDGYRSPFGGDNGGWTVQGARAAAAREGSGFEPGKEPILFAGFVLSNSETGGGAFTLTPRVVFKICGNGLTITRDALRNVHLGGKLDEGVVQWSESTFRRNLDLISAQTTDAVSTFLNVDYINSLIERIEKSAGVEIEQPAEAIKVVGNKLKFSQATMDGVLDHFIKGGQTTAGGVMQAVTSYAQTVSDADLAFELEGLALDALELAAK